MVGRCGGCVSSCSRCRISEKFSLGSQRMDGGRARLGLDQHQNHSRCSFLCYCNSHRSIEAMAGKRSYGPPVET
jgi:hypothetical protein